MKFQYKKIALTASVVVLGVGMIVFSTKLPGNNDSTKLEQQEAGLEEDGTKGGGTATPSGLSMTKDGTGGSLGSGQDMVETAAKDKGLEKNAYQEVNDLVISYMNAKLEGDEKKLAKLVDDTGYLNMTDIARRTERIEEYTTIDCYTLPGPEEGSYMVYVYSEVKVEGIDTLASGLDGLYVRPDGKKGLRICMGEVSDEVQKALSEDSEREDVKKLIQEVNEKFVQEVKKDEKLAAYYEELSVADVLDKKEKDTKQKKDADQSGKSEKKSDQDDDADGKE